MSDVTCLVHGRTVTVPCVRENHHTIWVRLADGRTVKRHKRKHGVAPVGWHWTRWVPLALVPLLALLPGCTGSAQRLADALNDREVTSCVWISGGYGLGAALRVVSATGGAELRQCLRHE